MKQSQGCLKGEKKCLWASVLLVFGFGTEAFLNEFCRRMQIFLDFGSLTRVSRVSSLDSFRPWHRHSGFLVGQTSNYVSLYAHNGCKSANIRSV